uniref:Uncharacterized protein n=1 Tax=Arundo donax TaxID=35708 RepID=A0A0A9CC15_ARUDO
MWNLLLSLNIICLPVALETYLSAE